MKDLFVRRVYQYPEFGNIGITVELDFVKKTVSLVEKDGTNKKWIFAERTPEYLNGWRNILGAMDKAIAEAKVEMDAITEKEHEAFVAMYMELDKVLKGKKDGR